MAGPLTRETASNTAVTGASATGRQLHDRATRGEALTQAEQASLAAWYERQDAEEGTMLAASRPVTEAALRHLRDEVEAGAARTQTMTQEIQAQIVGNEALRQEIAALTHRLVRAEA